MHIWYQNLNIYWSICILIIFIRIWRLMRLTATPEPFKVAANISNFPLFWNFSPFYLVWNLYMLNKMISHDICFAWKPTILRKSYALIDENQYRPNKAIFFDMAISTILKYFLHVQLLFHVSLSCFPLLLWKQVQLL